MAQVEKGTASRSLYWRRARSAAAAATVTTTTTTAAAAAAAATAAAAAAAAAGEASTQSPHAEIEPYTRRAQPRQAPCVLSAQERALVGEASQIGEILPEVAEIAPRSRRLRFGRLRAHLRPLRARSHAYTDEGGEAAPAAGKPNP
jgi:hypothetical protein